MSRIVSVWLPRWPILRMLAAQAKKPADKPIAPDEPFVLTVAGSGARASPLSTRPPKPRASLPANLWPMRGRKRNSCRCAPSTPPPTMRRCAGWRYGRRATRRPPRPMTRITAPTGFSSISKARRICSAAKHSLSPILPAGCKNFGLPARLAVASTPGAAWALSRFHAARLVCSAVAAGSRSAVAVADQGAAACAGHTRDACVGSASEPSARCSTNRARRLPRDFRTELLRRIDQALGRVDEPLVPVVAPPVYHSLRYLLEPIGTQDAVVALASRLMQTLIHVLTRDDVGARTLRLSLYRVDGAVEAIDIGADAADARRRPCGAAHRAQARSACGNAGRRRLWLRSDRPCRNARRAACRRTRPNSRHPPRMTTAPNAVRR